MIRPGTTVTVKNPVDCYYSGYAGRKKQVFNPGDTAKVISGPNPYPQIKKQFYFCKPTSFKWEEGLAIDTNNIKLL